MQSVTAGEKSALKKILGGEIFASGLRLVLSAVILLLVCNWHTIYEEDQMAKTAQITALARNSNWRHYTTVTDYYSKDLFSAYYLVASAFYKCTGLPALEALNFFSIGCGVIFFTAMPVFLRRVFQLPPWLSWCALINTPILIITFNYGNEAALAITATALAALALSFANVWSRTVGTLFYVLAAYSRSDYLLLWPALALLLFVQRDGGIDWRNSLKNAGWFAATSAVMGILYLALVLRKFPRPDYFETNATLKLFAAYFVYSPGLTNTLFALIGLGLCLVQRRLKWLGLLFVGAQVLPYLTHLESPKYIVPTVVMMTIFALAGMTWVLQRRPWLVLAAFLLPCFFAVSPYGIFGLPQAALWCVPSSDGPLPTGGYLSFYRRVKTGFYQRRYDEEVAQVSEVVSLIEMNAGSLLVGPFNHQALDLWASRQGRWDWSPQDWPFWLNDALEKQQKVFIIRMSYLYELKQWPKLRQKLQAAYREGRVRTAAGAADDPFPDVIEVGSQVPAGTNKELGARILFANSYYEGNHQVKQEEFLPDFKGVSWISRERFVKERLAAGKVVYLDDHWVGLAENVPNAVYYSMRFPPIYSRSRKGAD